MANSTAAAQRGATPDIIVDRDQWIPFCAEFTRQNRGAHAVLEVLGGDVGYQVETEDRPFDGIATDVKDGEHTAWITFGDSPEYHLAHSISNVTTIHVRPPAGLVRGGAANRIAGWNKKSVGVELPREYALPPAGAEEQ